MLIHLYILLAAAALFAFFSGLRYGSLGSGTVIQGDTPDSAPKYMTKLFLTAMLFLLSMTLFFILGAASYDVTIPHCDTVIDQTVLQLDNVTTEYTHATVCEYDQYTDEAVGDFFTGMAWASLIMLLIYSVKDLAGIGQ